MQFSQHQSCQPRESPFQYWMNPISVIFSNLTIISVITRNTRTLSLSLLLLLIFGIVIPYCIFLALGTDFISGLNFSASQTRFTSKYDGKTVTGIVGLSVNFTWSFSGDVDSVDWGLKKDGVNDFENNGVLVSLSKKGPVSTAVPSAYSGRVSGSGDASSGQVVFSLSQVKTSDDRLYGCRISPSDVSADTQKLDSVYLEVNGEYPFVIKTLGVARFGQNRTGCKLKCSLSCSTGSVAKKEVEGRQE